MRGLAAIVVTLVACRPAGGDGSGSVAAGEVDASAGARVAEPASRRCMPSLPDPPPGGPADAGPAYVVVDGVGVLRLDDDGVTIALPHTDGRSWDPEVALGPSGELWVSDWDGITVLALDGKTRALPLGRDDVRAEQLRVRTATDVWAVTSSSEWELVHFDGKRWTSVRRRAQFPGRFDDNKIDALAVTSDAVWVSSWNGLWRGVGDDWQRVEPPEGTESSAALWVYRDRLIAGYIEEHFLRDGDAWRALDWPRDVRLNRAVGEVGLVAAPQLDGPSVLLGAVEGGGCISTSDPVHGSLVHTLAVDGSARAWLATEEALAVVDGTGRILAEWTAGTLEGLTGRIRAVVVVGAGPPRLPAAKPARKWEIVGRMETHRGSNPLAGAAIELCGALAGEDRCAPTSFRLATTTGTDGSFRFVGVPEGELHLVVHPPEDMEDCQSIFSESGHTIAPARDCPGTTSAPLRCDLGTLTECLPFEMPPPH